MKYASKKQPGKVVIHARMTCKITLLFVFLPAPPAAQAIAVIFTWVVLTGSPKKVIANREAALPKSAQTAVKASTSAISCPIFFTIRLPPNRVPHSINPAQQKTAPLLRVSNPAAPISPKNFCPSWAPCKNAVPIHPKIEAPFQEYFFRLDCRARAVRYPLSPPPKTDKSSPTATLIHCAPAGAGAPRAIDAPAKAANRP